MCVHTPSANHSGIKRLQNSGVLILLAGAVCLILIYQATSPLFEKQDAMPTQRRLPPQQRLLCDKQRDPLLMDIGALKSLTEAFHTRGHFSETETRNCQASQTFVEAYLSRYPLHLLVKTDAHIRNQKSRVERSLVGVYYYPETTP